MKEWWCWQHPGLDHLMLIAVKASKFQIILLVFFKSRPLRRKFVPTSQLVEHLNTQLWVDLACALLSLVFSFIVHLDRAPDVALLIELLLRRLFHWKRSRQLFLHAAGRCSNASKSYLENGVNIWSANLSYFISNIFRIHPRPHCDARTKHEEWLKSWLDIHDSQSGRAPHFVPSGIDFISRP